ncbi:MAG: DUF3267 domain-containing protein [Chloroflexota bacterium]
MKASKLLDPPPTPAGYRAPYRFEFPKVLLNVVSLVLFIVLIPLLWQLIWWLQGQPAPRSFTISGFQDLFVLIVVGVLVPVLTIVCHELIHGLAFQLLGYKASYGIYWGLGPYAAAFGQFQTRQHSIIVVLAPLILINMLMLLLLAIPDLIVRAIACIALLFNTSGATGDLYLTWRLWRTPSGTLSYDVDKYNSFVFEPE